MNHTSLEELSNNRQNAYQQVEVGALYYHYRNPQLHYKVIDIGIQEASEKICIIYKALYGACITWVRDLDSWLAEIEVDGKKITRFQKVY